MNSKKQQLISEIDEIIFLLDRELTSEQKSDGWTERSREAMLYFFRDLREKISKNETVKGLSISRGMDHWGVTRGPLIEKAARISSQLREYSKI